jgi:hypothetical protein
MQYLRQTLKKKLQTFFGRSTVKFFKVLLHIKYSLYVIYYQTM